MILEEMRTISLNITKNRRTIINILNYSAIQDILRERKESKMRTEQGTDFEQNNKRLRHKNTENTGNKVNTTLAADGIKNSREIERITRWAYERANGTPSCSEQSFKMSVSRAIDKAGLYPVYSCFEKSENAIKFLSDIKSL